MIRFAIVGCVLALSGFTVAAADPVRLQESFSPGSLARVNMRMSGSGKLTLAPDKEHPNGHVVEISGRGSIDYDERVLDVETNGDVRKTLRIVRQFDLGKTVEKVEHKTVIRPEVRRLVVLRVQPTEVAFSPDGSLTREELDALRHDVFTPALRGLLPGGSVRPGETWKASVAAIAELTDLEKIDDGGIECRFDDLTTQVGRKVARVALSGTVRGTGEDGPVRHKLDGHLFFDLQTNAISYLSLQGVQTFLDKDGRETGRIDGTFTMTRQVGVQPPDLTESAIRGIALEPTEETTWLLYDDSDRGLRFEHPRAWRIARVENGQFQIDGPNGNSLLFTPVALKDLPTVPQYQSEVREFLRQQNGKLFGEHPARALQATPLIVQFAIEAEITGQRLLLDYYILKQKEVGATVAARLIPGDAKAFRPMVERLTRSITMSK